MSSYSLDFAADTTLVNPCGLLHQMGRFKEPRLSPQAAPTHLSGGVLGKSPSLGPAWGFWSWGVAIGPGVWLGQGEGKRLLRRVPHSAVKPTAKPDDFPSPFQP